MSRRPRKRKVSPWKKVLLWSGVGLLVLGGLFLGAGWMWLNQFRHSDKMRLLLCDTLGHVIHAEVSSQALQWSGSTCYTDRMHAEGYREAGFTSATAEIVRADLDARAMKRGVWSLPLITIDRFVMVVDQLQPPPPDLRTPPPPVTGFFAGWLPDRTELSEFRIRDAGLLLRGSGGDFSLNGLNLQARLNDSGNTILNGSGGTIRLPQSAEEIALQSLSANASAIGLQITDSALEYRGAKINGRGDIPFGKDSTYRMRFSMRDLDIKKMVSEEWRDRLTGFASAEADVVGSPDGVRTSGTMKLTRGVIERMPLLERVANYTKVERFRRLVLSTCEARFDHQGGIVHLDDLILESVGLVRMTGKLTVSQDGALVGSFDVGVTPEALRWLPGAHKKVFTETRPGGEGFVWTTMQVAGTADEPQENLSSRLMWAAGETLLIDTPLQVAEETAGLATDIIGGTVGSLLSPLGTAPEPLVRGENDVPGFGPGTVPTEPDAPDSEPSSEREPLRPLSSDPLEQVFGGTRPEKPLVLPPGVTNPNDTRPGARTIPSVPPQVSLPPRPKPGIAQGSPSTKPEETPKEKETSPTGSAKGIIPGGDVLPEAMEKGAHLLKEGVKTLDPGGFLPF